MCIFSPKSAGESVRLVPAGESYPWGAQTAKRGAHHNGLRHLIYLAWLNDLCGSDPCTTAIPGTIHVRQFLLTGGPPPVTGSHVRQLTTCLDGMPDESGAHPDTGRAVRYPHGQHIQAPGVPAGNAVWYLARQAEGLGTSRPGTLAST